MPACSHSSVPFGPRRGPPTPTQAAMWPPLSLGVPSGVIVALTPEPAPALRTHAYEYALAPHAGVARAGGATATKAATARGRRSLAMSRPVIDRCRPALDLGPLELWA